MSARPRARRSRRLPIVLAVAAIQALTACTPLPEYRAASAPTPASLPVPERVEGLAPGERIQALHGRSSRSMRTVRGRALSADSATLRLFDERGDSVTIPRGELQGLWVSRGTRSRGGTAAIGFVIGAIGGGLLGYSAGSDCSSDSFCIFDKGDSGLLGALGGGMIGGVFGALAGGGENWRQVQLSPRAALRIGPEPAAGGGVSLVRLELPRP